MTPNIASEASQDVWVTKDGRSIAVVDMTDTHLVNTVNFLRRNTLAGIESSIAAMMSPLFPPMGDMATEAFDREFDLLLDKEPDDILQEMCPTWNTLLAEIDTRGLECLTDR